MNTQIDLGSLLYTVPSRGTEKLSEIDPFIRQGISREEIVTVDTRPTVEAVASEIRDRARADAELSDFSLEWVHPCHSFEESKWPDDQKIVVSACAGGSEGWYVEIYGLKQGDQFERPWAARRLISIKTFEPKRVWTLASKVAAWLGVV